jgi:hypothetical protein
MRGWNPVVGRVHIVEFYYNDEYILVYDRWGRKFMFPEEEVWW